MTRVCKKCGAEKELNAERFRPHGHAPGFRHCCRNCERTRIEDYRKKHPGESARNAREWARNNPEQHAATKRAWRKANPRKHKSAVLRRAYGITFEDYEALLKNQGGGCAICGAENADSKGRMLHVDHCHATGQVRGLLCKDCNTMVGYAQDQPAILFRAAQYLRSV